MCGPQRAAGAGGAVKSALREILQCDAKRALDCALPAPGDGHTPAEHGGAVFNGIDLARMRRSTVRRPKSHRQDDPECP